MGAAFTYNFNTNAANGAGPTPNSGSTFDNSPVKDSVLNIKIGEKPNQSNADSNDTTIVGNTTGLVEEATALYFNKQYNGICTGGIIVGYRQVDPNEFFPFRAHYVTCGPSFTRNLYR